MLVDQEDNQIQSRSFFQTKRSKKKTSIVENHDGFDQIGYILSFIYFFLIYLFPYKILMNYLRNITPRRNESKK